MIYEKFAAGRKEERKEGRKGKNERARGVIKHVCLRGGEGGLKVASKTLSSLAEWLTLRATCLAIVNVCQFPGNKLTTNPWDK